MPKPISSKTKGAPSLKKVVKKSVSKVVAKSSSKSPTQGLVKKDFKKDLIKKGVTKTPVKTPKTKEIKTSKATVKSSTIQKAIFKKNVSPKVVSKASSKSNSKTIEDKTDTSKLSNSKKPIKKDLVKKDLKAVHQKPASKTASDKSKSPKVQKLEKQKLETVNHKTPKKGVAILTPPNSSIQKNPIHSVHQSETMLDIEIQPSVKSENTYLKFSAPDILDQSGDPGLLTNDEVYDETDQAQYLQLCEMAEIHRRIQEMNRPVIHLDFDGIHCIDCDMEIPPLRLAIKGCVRCIDCQEMFEKQKKRL